MITITVVGLHTFTFMFTLPLGWRQ